MGRKSSINKIKRDNSKSEILFENSKLLFWFLKILQGELKENIYDHNLKLLKTNFIENKINNISYMDNIIGLHNIENNGDELAVTFHIYSPPNYQTKYF